MTWDSVKRKLGYGSLAEESNLYNEVSGAVKSRHGFDAVVSNVVTSLLMQLFIPWIDYCFNKYSEDEFHKRMKAGFNFVQDMKENHIDRYTYIMKAVRRVRNRIKLDEEKLLVVVVHECNKRGWTITEWEKGRFREDIAMLIQEIYS